MRICLAYDEPVEPDACPSPIAGLPEDFGAEYEEADAIARLLAALEALGHEAVPLPFGEDFPCRAREAAPDLVFNICEGVRGPTRESLVPAWLDHLGIPHTGSDGLTLALTLDKAWTADLVSRLGVAVPRHRRVSNLDELEGLDFQPPFFVKPNAEGSSMGIRHGSMVGEGEALRRQVAWVLGNYPGDCLVEEFVPGREFCVALLGNGKPEVLPILEVRATGGFYSFEEKSTHRKEAACPAAIDGGLEQQLSEEALRVFAALRCRDLARMEFKLSARGEPLFLEINPLPGLAEAYSLFTIQARAAGMNYEAMIGRIVDLAMERVRGPRKETSI